MINRLGWLGLAVLLLSLFTNWPWLSLISVGVLFYLYYLFDKLTGAIRLLKIAIWQMVILIPLIVVAIFLNLVTSDKLAATTVNYLNLGVVIVLLCLLAYTNYLIAVNLQRLGHEHINRWLRYSGVVTKLAAFTLPLIGIGFVFLAVAQPLFLLGCITFKPKQGDEKLNGFVND